MEFTKAHGTANDFVVLPDVDDRLEVPDALVRALTDRRRGIGGDGLIRVGGPASAAAYGGGQVFMDYRNADGSAVEMCGNGVRVTAKLAVDRGLAVPDADGTVVVGTRAGPKPVRIVARDHDGRVAEVEVDMGPPVLSPSAVPFDAGSDDPARLLHPLAVAGHDLELAVVSMGNPHAITLVDDVDDAPVTTLGPQVETHPAFPARTNVEFVQVVADDEVRLRVWERGVGETAACGTGACATVVALQRLGHVGERVAVRLPGGILTIRWRPGGTVLMTGPAVEVGRGVLDDAWLADVLRDEPTPTAVR